MEITNLKEILARNAATTAAQRRQARPMAVGEERVAEEL